jgi:tetratricopeptide (TPR) repeat protein
VQRNAPANRDAALKAYRRLYYDYPTSQEAVDGQAGIERLQTADLIPPDRFKQELHARSGCFPPSAGRSLAPHSTHFPRARRVTMRDLVKLRVAECDYYLDRFRAAREGLQPYLKRGAREAEARFFYLTATRGQGDQSTYVELARKFVADYPDSPWSEETLNNLASHYIIVDDDDAADLAFRELSRRFPKSRYTERASWKVGVARLSDG